MPGKLFLQVEKENNPNSIVCILYSADSELVRQQLPCLSTDICQCVIQEDFSKILTYGDFTLTTQARVIPIKKGKIHVASKQVPEDIQCHTNLALSKIIAPAPKRLFPSPTTSHSTSPSTTSMSINSSLGTSISSHSSTSPAEMRFQTIEQELVRSSNRMDNIEDLCVQLKNNADLISRQINQLFSEIINTDQSPAHTPVHKSRQQLREVLKSSTNPHKEHLIQMPPQL